jgi:hypothetical protein
LFDSASAKPSFEQDTGSTFGRQVVFCIGCGFGRRIGGTSGCRQYLGIRDDNLFFGGSCGIVNSSSLEIGMLGKRKCNVITVWSFGGAFSSVIACGHVLWSLTSLLLLSIRISTALSMSISPLNLLMLSMHMFFVFDDTDLF